MAKSQRYHEGIRELHLVLGGQGVSVRGRVTDVQGAGIPDATVTIGFTTGGGERPEGIPFIPLTGRTDGGGNYEITGLPAGMKCPVWVTSDQGATHTEILALPVNGECERDFQLKRGWRLHGLIGDALGEESNVTLLVRERFDAAHAVAWRAPVSADRSLEGL